MPGHDSGVVETENSENSSTSLEETGAPSGSNDSVIDDSDSIALVRSCLVVHALNSPKRPEDSPDHSGSENDSDCDFEAVSPEESEENQSEGETSSASGEPETSEDSKVMFGTQFIYSHW